MQTVFRGVPQAKPKGVCPCRRGRTAK